MKSMVYFKKVFVLVTLILWSWNVRAQTVGEASKDEPEKSVTEQDAVQPTSQKTDQIEERSSETNIESSLPVASVDELQGEQSQPAPEAEQKEQKKSSKLQIASEDGNFTASPIVLAQPVFVIPVNPNAEHQAEGSGIMINRARLGFDASIFKIGSIRILGDFRRGTPELVDAYADVDPLKGNLVIRFGWFRPWFGRQRIGSANRTQFIDLATAWTDRQLGLNLNRDMGLALNGTAVDAFEWGIGIFNGEKNFALGTNRDFGLAARFAVHPLSAAKVGDMLKPGDETALKMPDKPALSIGSAISVESRRDRSIVLSEDEDPLLYEDVQLKVGSEVAFQWSRIALTTELFWMKTFLKDDIGADITAAMDTLTPTASIRGSGLGYYFQFGVMVVKDLLELAGRFDLVDEHLDTDGIRLYPTFNVNLYIKGHNLKLQTQYRANIDAGYSDDHPNNQESPSHQFSIMLQASI